MLEPKVQIVKKGFWAAFLAYFGFAGFTFWNGTIILRSGLDEARAAQVEKHERQHVEQMRRDGRFLFTVKYLYFQLKYGYKKNPYEIEARRYANEIIS